MTDSVPLHTIPTYFSKTMHPKDTGIKECPFHNSAVHLWNKTGQTSHLQIVISRCPL